MSAINEFFSTKELSALLDITSKCVIERAKREGWACVTREERGGGYRWRFSSMPSKTQKQITIALACRQAEKSVSKQVVQPVNRQSVLTGLPEHGQSKATARAMIVNAVKQIIKDTGNPESEVFFEFASLYKRKKALVPEWVYEHCPKISRSSIRDWTRKIEKEGIRRLAKQHEKRHPRNIIDNTPKLQEFVLGMLYEFPHASAAEIERGLKARFGPEGTQEDFSITLPCLRRIQAWLKKWKRDNAALLLARMNPDASKSKHKAAFGDAAAHVQYPNQEWQSDGTLADLMLNDGRRHTLNVTIDVYTRRAAFHVSRTSSTAAVTSGLRKRFLTWGIPGTWKTDNGSDYKNMHNDRVCSSLGIDHELCPPFSPEKKPFAERVFGTFLRSHVEILPGFIGHNVAERKNIEARKSFADRMYKKLKTPGERVEINLSPEELQKICDQWTEYGYGNDPHEGLDGITPNQKAAAYDGPIRMIENERALDILLLPCPGGNGLRTVTKKGIRITSKQHGLTIKGHYIGPDLGILIGRRVLVHLDDTDLGRVYLFDPETDEYLGKAEHPGWLGWTPEEIRNVAVIAGRKQKANISAEKKEWRKIAKRADVGNIGNEILETAARKASKAAPTSAQETIVHTTRHLEQAARAVTGDLVPPTPEQYAAAMARYQPEPEQAAFVPPKDDYTTVNKWLDNYRAMQKGESIPDDELSWMETVRKNNSLLRMHIGGKGIDPDRKLERQRETPALSEAGVSAQ